MNKMKKMFCALLAMVMVAGVCVIPTEASDNAKIQELQALIDSDDVGTIVLEEDITWADGEPIIIPENKSLILDLNGYTIESLENFPVFEVRTGAALYIEDSTPQADGRIVNAELFEGWEDVYEESWIGLFDLKEDSKLTLKDGFYEAGYKLFTSSSKGEVKIGYAFLNMEPNIDYSVDESYYLKPTNLSDGRVWWHPEFAIEMEYSMNAGKRVTSGQEIIFTIKLTNHVEYAMENFVLDIGYSTNKDTWWQDATSNNLSIFAQAVNGNGYVVEGTEAYIQSIGGGETVEVQFKGTLPENLESEKIAFFVRFTRGILGGQQFKGNIGISALYASIYQVTADTQDSVEKEDVSKPVENVTVVENQETESAVKTETVNVIAGILNGTASEEVVSTETAAKVSEAINAGKALQAELVVKEMTTEEIEQITDTDKKAIEDKVATELGEDANVQYLDLSIVLKADNEELGTLNKLQEEITITVAIPEELKADGRIYKVIRNHNEVVEVLDTVVNEDGTISFKTDRFSTYAIAYADKEETNTNPNPGTPSTDNNKDTNTNTNTNTNQSNKTPSTDSKAPQTGDNNSVLIYVAICFVALAAVLVTKRRKAFVK